MFHRGIVFFMGRKHLWHLGGSLAQRCCHRHARLPLQGGDWPHKFHGSSWVVFYVDIFSQEATLVTPLVTTMHPRWPLHGSGGCRKHKIHGDSFLQGRNICDAITQLIRQKIATFIYQSIFDAPHEGNPNLAKLFACFACPITVSVTVRCAPLELQCLGCAPAGRNFLRCHCGTNTKPDPNPNRESQLGLGSGLVLTLTLIIAITVTSDWTEISTESGSGPIQLARALYRTACR